MPARRTGRKSGSERLVSGPPPHRHLRESETFIVLEGELEFHRDGEPVRGGPGSIVHVPRCAIHTFRNVGAGPARFLVMVSPGGFERFFKRVGEPASDSGRPPVPEGPPDVAVLVALAREHDCEILAPGD
jgi:hypothetical protein